MTQRVLFYCYSFSVCCLYRRCNLAYHIISWIHNNLTCTVFRAVRYDDIYIWCDDRKMSIVSYYALSLISLCHQSQSSLQYFSSIFCADYINKLLFLAFFLQSFCCTSSNVTSVVVVNCEYFTWSLLCCAVFAAHTHTQRAQSRLHWTTESSLARPWMTAKHSRNSHTELRWNECT